MTCKGKCTIPKFRWKYKVKGFHGRAYADGWKGCSICKISLEYDGKWCPCCGRQLRTRPRSAVGKRNFLQTIKNN